MDDDLARAARAVIDRGSEPVHLAGVPWWEAPIPRRWHRCWTQTYGFLGHRHISRCACGAISYGDGVWDWKNQRRKDRRR